MSNVAIVGGGAGGVVAANMLRRRLGAEHEIVLFDRDTHHRLQASFLWVMTGKRAPEAVCRPLSRLEHKGIRYVNASVDGIDTEVGRLTAGGVQHRYDYLVLAPGAELAPQAIPGLSDVSHTPFDLDGAVALRDALSRFPGGRIVVLVAGMPYKCPAAPYEAALQIDWVLRQRGVRAQSEIAVYTWEPQPMPVAGKEMGDAVRSMLAARRVDFFPQMKIAEVDAEGREIVFESGDRVTADLVVSVPPHRLPRFCSDSGLAEPGAWLSVTDSRLMTTDRERVWAIGDAVMIKLPVGLPLPKAGVFAHHQASAVARNIAAEITGKGAPGAFDGHGMCWIESGGPVAGYGSGDFYAEPRPDVKIGRPNRLNHINKVMFERWWLWRWF
ncbi:MAG: NAD(P)/FAD-dependent oxidoreductase [Coriobacteriia bacterium]|nr:NAD(P)/FAD-dependent oxidoreductase [Coriobacteriia bacterium]